MANTSRRYNPAYSTVKSINLGSLNVARYNPECTFERIEMSESITEILPSGVLVVTDKKDIISYIGLNNIQNINITFMDGSSIVGHITSVSYINNAASDSETASVAINFTNSYYQYFSSNSLNALLGYQSPQVFKIDELVTKLSGDIFQNSLSNIIGETPETRSTSSSSVSGYLDSTNNYFLYKPFVPYNSGEEAVPDNALEFMNYLAQSATDSDDNPYFMFWTTFDGSVNFKSFKRDVDSASGADVNVGVYNGDAVIQKLADGETYRKAYFVATNPAYQWISKNYYYIRKTPKYLDELPALEIPEGLEGASLAAAIEAAKTSNKNLAIKNLTFHFQDDGQKYNIDVITIDGRGNDAPPGGDNIFIDRPWGYFDGQDTTNKKSLTNLIGNQYGTDLNYSALQLMGTKGNMPFLDSPDMWKNMFDLTPIHPNYPDNNETPEGTQGSDTYLQQVMDIRYKAFLSRIGGNCGGSGASDRLEKMRQIEAQNFVMYSLCCMGQKEDCFFAILDRYEPDSAYYGLTGSCGGAQVDVQSSSIPQLDAGAKYYRYRWRKIEFASGMSGSSGASGGCGGSQNQTPSGDQTTTNGNSGATCGPNGSTYSAHQLEKWALSCTVKASDKQDDTWAINLNERGLTGHYLPPGWVNPTLSSFKFRPIGANDYGTFSEKADIFHMARVCVKQVGPNEKLVYFVAENVVDGNC